MNVSSRHCLSGFPAGLQRLLPVPPEGVVTHPTSPLSALLTRSWGLSLALWLLVPLPCCAYWLVGSGMQAGEQEPLLLVGSCGG